MKRMRLGVICSMLLSITPGAYSAGQIGPYLGQEPPGAIPVVFAPGVISAPGTSERSLAFSPKGDELFFARGDWPNVKIMHMTLRGGKWSKPAPAAFLKDDWATQPVFSPDGQYLYFSTSRGKPNVEFFSIWRSQKTKAGWSKPEEVIDMGGGMMMEYHPSVSADGTLYFLYWDEERLTGDIYACNASKGRCGEAEKLKGSINTQYDEVRPTVDAQGKFLLFESRRPGGLGDTDLYVSFRNEDGTWSDVRSMGPGYNTAGKDDSPNISPDGKYWFISKDGDIYWRTAPVITRDAVK